jgi:hypothetical protein
MLGNVKTLPCRLQFLESEHATVGYMHCFEESYRQMSPSVMCSLSLCLFYFLVSQSSSQLHGLNIVE